MQVLARATGPELGQQVRAACAGPVLIAIACAQPYLGRPVPGEDDDRHRRSSFNRRGGEKSVGAQDEGYNCSRQLFVPEASQSVAS